MIFHNITLLIKWCELEIREINAQLFYFIIDIDLCRTFMSNMIEMSLKYVFVSYKYVYKDNHTPWKGRVYKPKDYIDTVQRI